MPLRALRLVVYCTPHRREQVSESVDEKVSILEEHSHFSERYTDLSLIGEGGFGSVYRARQTQTGQSVAIKLLQRPAAIRPDAHERRAARFRREMALCSRLHHPNIVRIIDSGVAGDDLYAVFEYVPGRTLSKFILEEGPLSIPEANRLMGEVLDALACAHRLGVVHRDLKPQNIMITQTGARAHAVVLDFGVAGITDAGDALETLTRTREFVGTPSYAAPEQLRGSEPTPAADLYSWALCYLESVTGERVINGHSFSDILYKQLGPEPIPVPAWIEQRPIGGVLNEVLDKDPMLREDSASVLLEMLQFLNEERSTALTTEESEGELRQLVFLGCQLSVDAPGDVASDELVWESYTALRDLVEQHEGELLSSFGDRHMACFGLRSAREDDAYRAGRAALALHRWAERRRPAHALNQALHVGIVRTGDAALRAAMSSAARDLSSLLIHAAPGTTAVSDAAATALRRRFVLRDVSGAQTLVEEKGPDQVDTFHNRRRPFFGREEELSLTVQRIRQAHNGSGQSVLITGEAGIGKSRFLAEVSYRIETPELRWLEARCAPELHNASFAPIAQLLEQLIGLGKIEGPAEKLRRLEQFLEAHGFSPPETIPLIAGVLSLPLPPTSPPQMVEPALLKRQLTNTLLALFFEAADQRPTVVVIEDLHWIDPTSLELLSTLIGEVSESQLAVLLAARPEFSTSWPTTMGLQLGRLGVEDLTRLAADIAGVPTLPPEVNRLITERSDGIALFAEELTRALIDDGLLRVASGQVFLDGPLDTQRVPTSLRALMTSRLDRLGAARSTAQLASAIGREFELPLLTAISSREPQVIQLELDDLAMAGLVFRRRRQSGRVYIFKHALIRDTAYESMLPDNRILVHARIGQALEQTFPGTARRRPDLLAYHFAAAAQKTRALPYAVTAAQNALQRSSNLEALSHGQQALTWLDDVNDEQQRATLELTLNSVLAPAVMSTRGYGAPELEQYIERSLSLLDEIRDGPHTFPTLWGAVMYNNARGGRQETAIQLARRLVMLSEQADSDDMRVAAYSILSICLFPAGHTAEAQQAADRTISLYDPARHSHYAFLYGLDPCVNAYTVAATIRMYRGRYEEAKQLLDSGMELARALKHGLSIGTILFYRCSLHYFLEQPAQVRDVAAQIPAIAEQYAMPLLNMYGDLYRAWADNDTETPRQILAMLEMSGTRSGYATWSSMVGDSLLRKGQAEDALQAATASVAIAESMNERYAMPMLYILQGRSFLATGNADDGERALRKAITRAEEIEGPTIAMMSATYLAEHLSHVGRESEIDALLTPLLERLHNSDPSPSIERARALIDP
ncbi:MAG: TOMM system kinase/cyclase fusion protein [Myxococcota bacterium]